MAPILHKINKVDTKIDDATYEVLPKCNIQYDLDQLTAPLSEKEIETALKQLKKKQCSRNR